MDRILAGLQIHAKDTLLRKQHEHAKIIQYFTRPGQAADPAPGGFFRECSACRRCRGRVNRKVYGFSWVLVESADILTKQSGNISGGKGELYKFYIQLRKIVRQRLTKAYNRTKICTD